MTLYKKCFLHSWERPNPFIILLVCLMVFNATFNNISVISWRSVLLVEEIGVPGENNRHVANHWQTLSDNVVSSALRHERDSNSQLFFIFIFSENDITTGELVKYIVYV